MGLLVLSQMNPGPWMHHGGGPGWIFHFIFLLVIVALVAVGIWLVVRNTRRHEKTGVDRAKDLLAERFARGEINSEEYRERLNELS